jgi:3-oxoacyl-[acyl-carrier protein] reductase
MMQQLAPGMRKRRYGRIILIGSVVQEMGGRGQMAYITSKSALSGLTKSFASELGDRNITANLILLGPVETEKFLGNTSSEIVSAIKDKMPNQRLIPVEQICNAADYLMSDQSSFVNGATLHLSGGIHLKQI